MTKPSVVLVVALFAPFVATARAEAPPTQKTAEQQFKNIQVLKGMPASQMSPAMDFISSALGVECSFCHVSSATPGGPWAMEKDDKQAKRVARKMITMQQRINHDFFGGGQVVTCATCHQGHAEPTATPPMVRAPESPEGAAKPPALTVQQVLDRWVQATGGKAAWEKLKTRVTHGTLSGEHGDAMPLEVTQSAPNHWRTQVSFRGMPVDRGFDGKSGWQRSPRGVRDLSVGDLRDLSRDAPLALPLRLAEVVSGLKVVADEPVGKSPAHVLQGTTEGVGVRLSFDAKTGLLLRWATSQPTPLGDLPQEIRLRRLSQAGRGHAAVRRRAQQRRRGPDRALQRHPAQRAGRRGAVRATGRAAAAAAARSGQVAAVVHVVHRQRRDERGERHQHT